MVELPSGTSHSGMDWKGFDHIKQGTVPSRANLHISTERLGGYRLGQPTVHLAAAQLLSVSCLTEINNLDV